MRKIAQRTIVILVSLLFVSLLFPGEKTKEQNLDQKYRDFLKLMTYIILP
jgi:hypothetical protein